MSDVYRNFLREIKTWLQRCKKKFLSLHRVSLWSATWQVWLVFYRERWYIIYSHPLLNLLLRKILTIRMKLENMHIYWCRKHLNIFSKWNLVEPNISILERCLVYSRALSGIFTIVVSLDQNHVDLFFVLFIDDVYN